MTLQSKIKKIGEALAQVTPNCAHYYRTFTAVPYLLWAENGEGDSLHAGNHKTEQVITGTVDYFTQTEYDANADAIQDTLDALGVGWVLESVQYEDDTKLIHYEWSWNCGYI